MSTPDWLSRLDRATNYAELREIFDQISSQAHANSQDEQLAATVEQAIQRLLGERARDERGLSDVQARYESFKEDNRGVVGWLKRHLPFTDTRREERSHRSEVANQMAEILADNLVIARAQMIRERLLPPTRRRLGRSLTDWNSTWEQQRNQPVAAAQLLAKLHAELAPSGAFLTELKQDIDAFAGAEFRDGADRQRRDADVQAARREWNELNQEVAAKSKLKQEGLQLLSEHVVAELTVTDSAFRRDGEQLEKLRALATRWQESHTELGKLVAAVAQVSECAKQLQDWPEQLRLAREVLARADGDRASAVQASASRGTVVQERHARLADAQRSADQAAQMLASLQPAYDAHLAAREASKSMPQAVEAEPPALIVEQFETAQRVVEQAKVQVREVTASLDAARRESKHAEDAIQAAAEKVAQQQKKLGEIEKQEPALRAKLAEQIDRGRREFAAAALSLAAYVNAQRTCSVEPSYRPEDLAAGTFGWLGKTGLETPLAHALFDAGRDLTRHLQASAMLQRVNQWQESQQKGIEQQRQQAHQRRDTAWKHRCRELLGESLATEACAAGLRVDAER